MLEFDEKTFGPQYHEVVLALEKGLPDQARSVVDEMMAKAGSKEADVAAAQVLGAQVCVAGGNLQDAVQYATKAAEGFGKLGDAIKKAGAVNTLANVLRVAGMLQDAQSAAKAAYSLCREADDKKGTAASLCMMATICDAAGDYGKAAFKLDRAAKIYRQLNDKKEEAQTLEAVASTQLKTFDMLDDASEPAKLCEKAASLYGQIGMSQSPECGYLMQTLAFALLAQGKSDEALAKATQSLDLFRELSNSAGEAAAYNKLAQIHWSRGEKDDAAKMAGKGVKIASDVGEIEEATWGNQLVEQYSGGTKKKGKEEEAEITRFSLMTDIGKDMLMYVNGVDYFLFLGGLWRGTSAPAPAKSSSSSAQAVMESLDAPSQSSLNIDWQKMGTL